MHTHTNKLPTVTVCSVKIHSYALVIYGGNRNTFGIFTKGFEIIYNRKSVISEIGKFYCKTNFFFFNGGLKFFYYTFDSFINFRKFCGFDYDFCNKIRTVVKVIILAERGVT